MNQDNTDNVDFSQNEGEGGGELKSEVQNEELDQSNNSSTQTSNDPLQFLESLDIDSAAKQTLREGFLRQSDYTKKTQELALERNLINEYKDVKPYLNKVLNDPELYEKVFGENQNNNVEQKTHPEDPIEFANWVKNETIRELHQQFDLNQAELVDPRLNSDSDFAQSIAGLLQQDKQFISGNKTAVQATREAVAKFDNFLNRQKNNWRNELNQQINQKRMSIPNENFSGQAGTGKTPLTMREAMKMAEDQFNG